MGSVYTGQIDGHQSIASHPSPDPRGRDFSYIYVHACIPSDEGREKKNGGTTNATPQIITLDSFNYGEPEVRENCVASEQFVNALLLSRFILSVDRENMHRLSFTRMH